ncbi:hypothetical protein JCM10212_001550 [Sporobolomyces blumeae]
MRRTGRRSPNARSERPAPSTIATSDFSDLTATVPLGRRVSLSSLPARRTRASSHSPPPASSRPEPSGSRSRRHLDPDQHWLSEDEATGQTGGMSAVRQRTSGRRQGVQRGTDGDDDDGAPGRKQRLDDVLASATSRNSHEIHHRPAKFVSPPTSPIVDDVTDEASIASILPRLVSLLTCSHCHLLLSEPVTFGCGHSRCKSCPSIAVAPAPPPVTITAFSVPDLQAPSLPDLSLLEKVRPPEPTSANSGGSIPGGYTSAASSEAPSSPRLIVQPPPPLPPTCGLPNCRHAEFSPLPPSFVGGPKTDFTLRKIVEHVRRSLVEIDPPSSVTQVADSMHVSADRLSVASHADKSIPRMPSDSSGSSGGGEEQTLGDDDSKRAHKSRSGFVPAKKTRRMSETAIDEDEDDEREEGQPVLGDDATRPLVAPPTSFVEPPTETTGSTLLADLQAESECQVCVQLFHEPVTSPCGHSFCQKCFARAYDHSDKCPLCRSDLPPLSYFVQQCSNFAIRSVIDAAFPALAAERAASLREEELAQLANVPLFVCTTAWPGIPTFLHVFEPRYRLMMRRALESPTREFGMVLPSRDGGGAVNEYGTMLRITSCRVMEDGRSIINSVGTWRFRILDRWMYDGYNVGRVERVDDVSLEQEIALEQAALLSNEQGFNEWQDPDPPAGTEDVDPSNRPSRPPITGNYELTIEQLMQICLDFIRTLRSQSAPWVIQRLNNTVGEMPTTPAEFTWWCGEVMPVEDHVKVALLAITSVRERLRLIVFWIEQFRSSWWYSRGCTVS